MPGSRDAGGLYIRNGNLPEAVLVRPALSEVMETPRVGVSGFCFFPHAYPFHALPEL